MNQEKTFKTAFGFCQIHTDKIVFIDNEEIKKKERTLTGNDKKDRKIQILLLLGISIFLLPYAAFVHFQKGEIIIPIFYILGAIYLIYSLIEKSNYSSPSNIYREKIKKIYIKRQIFNKSYYVIKFIDDNGKIKKCGLPLLTNTNEEKLEKEKAIKILKEEKLIKYQ